MTIFPIITLTRAKLILNVVHSYLSVNTWLKRDTYSVVLLLFPIYLGVQGEWPPFITDLIISFKMEGLFLVSVSRYLRAKKSKKLSLSTRYEEVKVVVNSLCSHKHQWTRGGGKVLAASGMLHKILSRWCFVSC